MGKDELERVIRSERSFAKTPLEFMMFVQKLCKIDPQPEFEYYYWDQLRFLHDITFFWKWCPSEFTCGWYEVQIYVELCMETKNILNTTRYMFAFFSFIFY